MIDQLRFFRICYRSSYQEEFLRKGVLKTCSKVTGEHPCRSAISIKLQSMGVFLYICCIFSEYFFLRTRLGDCFRYQLKRGYLNLCIDIRYSIVQFNGSLLTEKLQLDKICQLIFLILFRRVCAGVWKLGQVRKKCVIIYYSK